MLGFSNYLSFRIVSFLLFLFTIDLFSDLPSPNQQPLQRTKSSSYSFFFYFSFFDNYSNLHHNHRNFNSNSNIIQHFLTIVKRTHSHSPLQPLYCFSTGNMFPNNCQKHTHTHTGSLISSTQKCTQADRAEWSEDMLWRGCDWGETGQHKVGNRDSNERQNRWIALVNFKQVLSYNCNLSQTLMEQFGHFWSFKIGKYKGTNSNHILELAQVWDIGISKPILIGIWNWLYKLQLWFLKVWEYFQHDQWIQKYRSERWPDETNEDKRK